MAHASVMAMQIVLSDLAILIVGSADVWLIDHVWNTVDNDIRAAVTATCWALLLISMTAFVSSQSSLAQLLLYTTSFGDALWNWIDSAWSLVLLLILIVIHYQTIRRVVHTKSNSED